MRIIALGFFDGVHLGHAALLRQTRQLAAELGAAAACLTYDRHPGALLGQPTPLLNTPAERAWLMRRQGMDEVLTLPFDETLLRTPWEVFAAQLLTAHQAAGLVCGTDHRFGAGAAGTAERLRDFAAAHGLPCHIVPPVLWDGQPVSSTRIRAALECGDLAAANRLLGHPHLITGVVEHGKRLGSRLGFPTANLPLAPEVLAPCHGVYATRVTLPDGRQQIGVTNIGLRPTVEQATRVNAETWLLDFDGDLYGQPLRLELLHFLRRETRFDGADALRAQVMADAQTARRLCEEDDG